MSKLNIKKWENYFYAVGGDRPGLKNGVLVSINSSVMI